jgi:hypothetical protein
MIQDIINNLKQTKPISSNVDGMDIRTILQGSTDIKVDEQVAEKGIDKLRVEELVN